MKRLIAILVMTLLGLTACSKSKPIEKAEVVGEWEAIKRWGKGPMSGSIIFRADGTCETVKLPWGAVTGDETHLGSAVWVIGKWKFEFRNGKQSICLTMAKPKTSGATFTTWIHPELRGGEWTFRQYIGDPDLMDIVEFKKRAASLPTEKR